MSGTTASEIAMLAIDPPPPVVLTSLGPTVQFPVFT